MFQKLLSSRLIRFGAVGCVVTVFFMGLNFVLSRLFGMAPGVAFLVAYPPALCLHFLLNKLWTFGDGRSTSSRHLAEYFYSVVVTFLIQWPAFSILHEGMRLPGWLAAGGANVLQMAASFGMLKWRVFSKDASVHEGAARDSWHRLMLLLCGLATSALIAWTVLGKWGLPDFNVREGDYYNLLVSGFKKGSLALDVSVPDALKNAANPWNPDTRPNVPYLHDASFYHGRYYLYFGVVPVVILFLPFRLLTGLALPFALATVVFLVGANIVSSLAWLRIIRERFPRAGLLTKIGGVLALGICGGQLALARRPSIWEMPIGGGYFFVTLLILFGYLALASPRRRLWFALAGLSLGLAVGCRPTLVTCGGGLVVLVLAVGIGEAGPVRRRFLRSVDGALSAGIPLALVMACLFAYNYGRFGSPFEFGIKYQLNTNYEAIARHFRISFVGFNFRAYFLSVPRFGRYFPFLHQPELGKAPTDYYGTEFVYGVFIVCPLIWGAAFLLRRFSRKAAGPLPAFSLFLASLAIPVTCVLLCFDTAAARYTVDFIPLWIWLAMLGWANLEAEIAEASGRASWRVWGGRVLFGTCLAISLLCAVVLSLSLHGILVFSHPDTYFKIARAFNLPVAALERARGEKYGKLVMDVTFPEKPSGSLEPLVVTGVGYESDYFFAYYRSDKMVQIGFENSGDSMLLSQEIHYDPARVYRLGFSSGSVLPPEGHPIYSGWSEYDLHSLLNWVRIDVDGAPVINQERQGHEGAPELLQIGRDERGEAFGRRFAGKISNVHREPLEKAFRSPETHGDVVLDVSLPSEVVDGAQPLVVAGKAGNAELIGYRTLDMDHFCIAYEYWGAGEWESIPIEVPPDRKAHFRIRLGSVLTSSPNNPYYNLMKDDVIVWMNGRPVFWRKSAGPMAPQPRVEILANIIGSSGMRRSFQGVLWSEHRDPAPTWRRGPFNTLDLYLAGRGVGSQPLVATGQTGRADTIAIAWLPGNKAQIIYDHWGSPLFAGKVFEWSENDLHHVRIQSPSFKGIDKAVQGDGEGQLLVTVDGQTVADRKVLFFDSLFGDLVYGKNIAGSSVAGQSLDLYVGDIAQEN